MKITYHLKKKAKQVLTDKYIKIRAITNKNNVISYKYRETS